MNRQINEEEFDKVENAYLRGLTEINSLKHQIRSIKSKLRDIRNNPNSWKAARYSGADMYQGEPSFLRIIDSIIGED